MKRLTTLFTPVIVTASGSRSTVDLRKNLRMGPMITVVRWRTLAPSHLRTLAPSHLRTVLM